ncbi:MmpS family transport accessory protein [Streptomyces rubiginosohelvolus]|uniref:MmpS family transport accessory protein n=1 Tax=Streptomyces rubiginosohelvolus TaxID=67362 RepID=UPI0036C3CBF5
MTRNRLVAGTGALLFVGGAGLAYGLLTADRSGERPVPTAEVAYEVTGSGTADITYLARSTSGTTTTERGVRLPWKKTVEVPLGEEPVVRIQLDAAGGQAGCALSVRGDHRQRATAQGAHGKAVCVTERLDR